MGLVVFFFQAEDGIRDLVRSRGLGDVYKRQGQLRDEFAQGYLLDALAARQFLELLVGVGHAEAAHHGLHRLCLLYTSDAADERSSVDLGGRRIINKKTTTKQHTHTTIPS